MLSWSALIWPAQRYFRKARAQQILKQFPDFNDKVVVDIGGSLHFWEEVSAYLHPKKVIIYNISHGAAAFGCTEVRDNIELHLYDGLKVPLPDGYADIVLCNSVIEHVPLDHRGNLSSEIRRLGKNYIVQTPSPAFPLEMHFGLPFVHWLPRKLAREVVRISPFALLTKVNVPVYFDETRLLSEREFVGFFPDGKLIKERFVGIPKSYLIMRN